MERRDARLFQHDATNKGWNIVELESHRQFRQRIYELVQLAHESDLPTSDVRQHIRSLQDTYPHRFTPQLVRALHREDAQERQAVVWLLTLLDDEQQQIAIPLLQRLAHDKHQARALRLSASLALAGMNATEETNRQPYRKRLYAIR
jgi:hypothetical protein